MPCLYDGADFAQEQNLTQLLAQAPWMGWGEKTGRTAMRNLMGLDENRIITYLSLSQKNRLDLGIMNLIYEKLKYLLSDSSSGRKYKH